MTIDDYLAEVRVQLENPRAAREQLDELREALSEAAEDLGAEQALLAFGSAAETASRINAETRTTSTEKPTSPLAALNPVNLDPRTAPARLLGIFNPCDHRIIVPKVMGIGWTINLGALAVRARLLDPDHLDADTVGSITPAAMLRARLVVVTALVIAAALFTHGLGKDRLPNHWPLFGPPDGWIEPGIDQLPLLFVGLAGLALAWLPELFGASRLWQLLLILGATNLSLTCPTVLAMQVFGGNAAIGWLLFFVLLAILAVTVLQGALLVRDGARAAARNRTTTTQTVRS